MKVKRLIPVLLALAMFGGVFAGCADKDGGTGTEGEGGQQQTGGETGGSTGGETGGNTPGGESGGNTGDNTGGEQGGGQQQPAEHKHTYSTEWTSVGAEGHYHMATCEHKTEHDELKPHDYTGQNSNVCVSCGYEKPTYTQPTEMDESTPLDAGKKIYVVGDSTVCSFSDDYYLPRYGYGTQLFEYLNVEEGQVINLAKSGRSSKSFLTEANYSTLKTSIAEGDYLIIGFGHNDEKSDDAARFTDPNGTKDVKETAKGDSFKYTLYNNYVKLAKDKGATPILCTPIVRYNAEANYSGSSGHVTEDGNYPKAIRELGAETDTAVVDLTDLTKFVYLSDNEAAKAYHAHASYSVASNDDILQKVNGEVPYTGNEPASGMDGTHINKFGAKMVAYNFAQALLKTDCDLKASVRTDTAMPTKADSYLDAVNKQYVKKPYNPFDPTGKTPLATTGTGESVAQWFGTTFGVTGTSNANGNCSLGMNGSKFVVDASSGKGTKFNNDAGDGFAAIFTKIDISKNFKITAKATVTQTGADYKASNQSAFGIMLRDDIYINTPIPGLKTNFVAASVTANGKAFMDRQPAEDGTPTLTTGSKTVEGGFALNSEYAFSLERTGQVVKLTVTHGGKTLETTYTDFDFCAVDYSNMYLCLFANRCLKVEFAEVLYEVTGTSEGA